MNSQWYEAKTGNHQGLIIEEGTGRNVAVTYDKSDSAIIAAAPDLYLFVASKAESGDNEALELLERIHGNAKRD